MRRITKNDAYRGMTVKIELRDGTTATGTLVGWGDSTLVFTADADTRAAGRFTAKRDSLHKVQISNVYAV